MNNAGSAIELLEDVGVVRAVAVPMAIAEAEDAEEESGIPETEVTWDGEVTTIHSGSSHFHSVVILRREVTSERVGDGVKLTVG